MASATAAALEALRPVSAPGQAQQAPGAPLAGGQPGDPAGDRPQQPAAEPGAFFRELQNGGVMAAYRSSEMANDFDRLWALLCNPVMFPHGHGCAPRLRGGTKDKPKYMSFGRWFRLILRRCARARDWERRAARADLQSPKSLTFPFDARLLLRRPQIYTNHFLACCFDVLMKHKVSDQSFTYFRNRTGLADLLTRMSAWEVNAVFELLKQNKRFDLKDEHVSPTVRELMKAFHAVAAEVPCTPSATFTVRNKVLAGWSMWGAFTIFVNINPFEKAAKFIFESAGQKFEYDVDSGVALGQDTTEAKNKMYETIVNNPVACAEYNMAVFRAFVRAFFGFSLDGSRRQEYPDCVFGLVRRV